MRKAEEVVESSAIAEGRGGRRGGGSSWWEGCWCEVVSFVSSNTGWHLFTEGTYTTLILLWMLSSKKRSVKKQKDDNVIYTVQPLCPRH